MDDLPALQSSEYPTYDSELFPVFDKGDRNTTIYTPKEDDHEQKEPRVVSTNKQRRRQLEDDIYTQPFSKQSRRQK